MAMAQGLQKESSLLFPINFYPGVEDGIPSSSARGKLWHSSASPSATSGKGHAKCKDFYGWWDDVSSRHHCTGKNTQTPADCKPAHDTPHAATCSLGDDFQWSLPKDRAASHHLTAIPGQRIYKLKTRKSLSRQNTALRERGKEWNNMQVVPMGCSASRFVASLHASGRCPLQSESELLLELLELLECWRR